MLYTTNSADLKKLESAKIKALKLCKLHKCSLIDLLVMSMQVQAQNKKNNKI
jgi:hypothetical protein